MPTLIMNDEEQNIPAPAPLSECAQCAEYLGGWQRALADYDNLRKDLARERGRVREEEKIALIIELLPVLDNFTQAVDFAPPDLPAAAENWLQGVLHIQNQLIEVLRGLGAKPYGQVGEIFDPHRHNAAQEVADPEIADQVIVRIIAAGWSVNEQIIRPAKVAVNNIKFSA